MSSWCRTWCLIFNSANLFSLTIACFYQRFATNFYNFLGSFWIESDLTTLLKVLPTDLLQTWLIIGDIADMALLLLAVGALHHRVCLHGLDHVLLGYTQLSRLCHSATRWHSSEVYLLGSWWRWWWCNRWNLIIWCLNIILVKSVKNWRLSTSILLFIMSAANLIAFIRVSKDILPPLLPPWIVSISCLNSGVDRPPAESVTGLELSCLEKYF